MPGLKKFSKRSDPTSVLAWGDRPTQKYCFVDFSAEVIIRPVRVPLINGGLKKGTSGGVRTSVRSENPGHHGARDFHKGVRSDLPGDRYIQVIVPSVKISTILYPGVGHRGHTVQMCMYMYGRVVVLEYY